MGEVIQFTGTKAEPPNEHEESKLPLSKEEFASYLRCIIGERPNIYDQAEPLSLCQRNPAGYVREAWISEKVASRYYGQLQGELFRVTGWKFAPCSYYGKCGFTPTKMQWNHRYGKETNS